MKYVFDTGIFFIIFRHYYRESFVGFWEKFDSAIDSGQITSTREVFRELSEKEDSVSDWAKHHKKTVFAEPTMEEMEPVAKIFRDVPSFEQNVKQRNILQGTPCADIFVISKALVEKKCVVTTEKLKPNAVGIPNICEKYKIGYTNLEGFLKREGWKF